MLSDRMNQLITKEKEFEKQLDVKEKLNVDLKKNTTVLMKENAELQSLCEELMNIVESNASSTTTSGSVGGSRSGSRNGASVVSGRHGSASSVGGGGANVSGRSSVSGRASRNSYGGNGSTYI
mmetsp:Transcript_5915/g.6586  ORF Transcript_5915/g.6586 Transcript_5915/m.6586 type:complete len:123 (-) Transcript_5915:156-524(-)